MVDLLVFVLLLLAAVAGWQRGLVRSALSATGFVLGGAFGWWLAPPLLRQVPALYDTLSVRYALVLFAVIVLASVGQGFGAALGRALGVHRVPLVHAVDAVLGMIASIVVMALAVWFVGGAARSAFPGPVSRELGSSEALAILDDALPQRATDWSAELTRFINATGAPQVFTGLRQEPIPSVAAPDRSITSSPAVLTAAASVVKIASESASCGRSQEGSGWVVAPQRVVTNAHVIAGSSQVSVQPGGTGRVLPATVVGFDARLDLAILQVPRLDVPVLSRGTDLAARSDAVVAGYPLDGPYVAGAARVRSVMSAGGSDIYGRPGVSREIYSLYATVRPGNSGGPVLSADGKVVGTVFATSLDDKATGYALTDAQSAPFLDRAASLTSSVSTGACVTD